MNRQFWLLRGLKFVLFAALFITAIGFGTQYLWNWLVPTLFHGPAITLGQTYGLLVLTRILFGFRGGHQGGWAARRQAWKRRMSAKLEGLSPEDRENLRAKMARHCGGPEWLRNRAGTAASEPVSPAI